MKYELKDYENLDKEDLLDELMEIQDAAESYEYELKHEYNPDCEDEIEEIKDELLNLRRALSDIEDCAPAELLERVKEVRQIIYHAERAEYEEDDWKPVDEYTMYGLKQSDFI